ncbi:acetoacetate--CoA ligase [Amycolatopsis sp. GM8]|uniref:acetoacetate--CoA ligase n=1 Tax=Amycolatopsis sp. GM8 TaxID=2896530 RepID=UPI001F003524|nr:acetoacetate--CoA ligase [Amycolatopsis sp. GM8]
MRLDASDAVPLWQPSDEEYRAAAVSRFARFAGQSEHYPSLWRWSIEDIERFWATAAEFLGVRWSTPPERVLGRRAMPGTEWLPGGRLSFTEHIFAGRDPEKVAVCFASEARPDGTWTWGDLRRETARIQAGLVAKGVGPGDRVAAYLPNAPETVAAFLATTGLGAIWSSAAPEFGVPAVVSRFSQIQPKVLLAVDGYRYKGRDVDREADGRSIAEAISAEYVRLGYLDGTGWEPGFLGAQDSALRTTPVDFDHPLWVLYSSGTTGQPKSIVHSHGGILLELLKTSVLQLGLRPADRFFWFTTTGWVMWNIVVGALLADAAIVLYDGNPGGDELWRLAARTGTTFLGTSAAFLDSCLRNEVKPPEQYDLTALRAIGSTGSPLAAECYDWVYRTFPERTWLLSISGGTDVVGPFLGAAPTVPVYRGELGPAALGVDLRSYTDDGRAQTGAVGEMVIGQPMPSMPVYFWGDDDGQRLRDSYFSRFPGVWTHGDWLELTARGTGVITGRSDATINRGGVRMGTAEIYQALLDMSEVDDAIAVDLSRPGAPGRLILLVALADGHHLDDALRQRIRTAIRTGCSPRHVPDEIAEIPEVPRTSSGKRLEIPVKRILQGADPDSVVSRSSLANPAALDAIVTYARQS